MNFPTKVLMVSSDRKLFEEGSPARARMREYAALFEELHVIVFARRRLRLKEERPLPNLFFYPTNSWGRLRYVCDAVRLGRRIVSRERLRGQSWIVSAQDPFECGLAGYRIARKNALPLQIQVHTDIASPFFIRGSLINRVRGALARFLLPKAAGIRVVSKRIKDSLLREFGLHSHRIDVLPIFVDCGRLSAAPVAFDLKKKYPGLSPLFLSVARFSPEKDLSFGVRLLAKLRARWPDAGYLIVGEGIFRKRIEREAKRLGVSGRVVLAPWQKDLVPYYKGADLFLQTSRYEGYGLALVEALAAGAPAVSTDVGVAGELLRFSGRSFVCPVGGGRCFLEKIAQVLSAPAPRDDFEAARKLLPLVTSPDKNAYLERYRESVLSCRKGALPKRTF